MIWIQWRVRCVIEHTRVLSGIFERHSKITIRVRDRKKTLAHQGIKVQFVGRIGARLMYY